MRTNGRFLFNVLYLVGCGMCLGALVTSSEVAAQPVAISGAPQDPFTSSVETEDTLYFLSYNGTEYRSCTKSNKADLVDCLDTVADTLTGDPPGTCSPYKGWHADQKAYTMEGGNHQVTETYVAFYSAGYYKYGGCYYYESTGYYRLFDILEATFTTTQQNCELGRASGTSQFIPNVGYNCLDVHKTDGESGCSLFVDGYTTNHYSTGDTYSWTAETRGFECDPTAVGDVWQPTLQDVVANENSRNQQTGEATDDPNPFVCTETPDGLLNCINLNHHDEDPAFVEQTSNLDQPIDITQLSAEGCTPVADTQYLICPDGEVPPENTNENSEDDRTLISESVIQNEYTEINQQYNTYTYQGSATEYGQPDEDINDTGGDTDGDGDSDGDTDGDGDSDNADVIAKLNEIKAKQAGTNSKLNTISNQIGEGNQKLDGIKSSVDGLGDKLDGVKDAVEDLNNADEFNAPTDGEEYGDSLNDYWGRLENAPIIQAVDNVIPAEQEGSCPPLEFELFDWGTVGTTMHCDLWEQATPIIEVMSVVAWSLLGLFILLSA